MDAGLPPWFALDQWFPALFEVQAACGYTPFILFQITMAEILMVLSAMRLSLAVALFVASWFNN
jgi:disulfide bond formation protein DsbB